MKRLLIALSVLFVLVVVPALAQEKPSTATEEYNGAISPGELTPTTDMWFYQQYERQYRDPKLAVRRKAEFRASERQRRIAARKWFGFSNLRPTVSSDPFHGDWSPHWASNNYFYPDRWQGVGQPWTIMWPVGYGTRLY